MSYDELDDRQGGSSFLIGFIAGSILGAGLALLYAPKTGQEMRREVAGRAERLGKRAAEEYDVASARVAEYTDRGREAYQTAAGKAREFARRGRHEAEDVLDRTREAFGEAGTHAEAGVAAAKANLRDAGEPRG